MLFRILAGLLALALVQAPAAVADNTIRFTMDAGKKRAEFRLNGNIECILENDRITCDPTTS